MKKFVLVAGLLIVIVAVIAGIRLFSNLDSIVAAAIEKNGSAATGTAVSVAGVQIKLKEGRGSVEGLRIGNPEGFQAADVFVLGDITLDLDVGSVRRDPIVLEEVRIASPVVSAEFAKDGTLNLDVLRKHLQGSADRQSASAKSDDASKANADSKRLRIQHFVFEKARIEVDATALGIEKRTLDLPEIRLEDVGGQQGVPPEQMAQVILNAVAKRTASEITRSEVNHLIEKQIDGSLTDKAKGLLDNLRK